MAGGEESAHNTAQIAFSQREVQNFRKYARMKVECQ